MAKEPNENAELDEDIEEGAEGEEDIDTSTDGDNNDDEGADDADADVDTEGDDDEGDDKGEGDDADFVIPDKFKGKDAKAIAKAYVELEGLIEKKASKRARELSGGDRKIEKPKPGETPEWMKKALEGVDFSKMKPEDFAKFMLTTIESRAQEIARNTFEAADSTKAQVQRDIDTVTKTWPQLKEHEGFRNIVLTLIENKASKGEILPLKEACKQAAKMLNMKPGDKKPADGEGEGDGKKDGEGEKKKPKLGLERGGGSGSGEKQTDEEKVLEGLLGGKTPGTLGGLY